MASFQKLTFLAAALLATACTSSPSHRGPGPQVKAQTAQPSWRIAERNVPVSTAGPNEFCPIGSSKVAPDGMLYKCVDNIKVDEPVCRNRVTKEVKGGTCALNGL